MYSPQTIEWDRTLKMLFDEVDDYLEDKYGQNYPLHPNRPQRGEAANKEMDGLFNIGVSFSPGYGSSIGRGYVLDMRISTLEHIDFNTKKMIENDAVKLVKDLLPKYFPDRDLKIEKDGAVYKIYGDLSLGEL